MASHFLEDAFERYRTGRLDLAVTACERLLQVRPDWPEALHLLGMSLWAQSKPKESLEILRRAAILCPASAEIPNTIGTVLASQEDYEGSVEAFRRALANKEDQWEVWNNLGNSLAKLGRHAEAISALHRSLELQTGNWKHASEPPPQNLAHRTSATLTSLGASLKASGNLQDGLGSVLQARKLAPRLGRGLIEEAQIHTSLGDAERAIRAYRELIQFDPGNHHQHSNLLFSLHNSPNVSREQLFQEHVRWAERHAIPLYEASKPHLNDRSPKRRLRVGFVSGNFRFHIVGRLLMPLLRYCNKEAIEVICYSDLRHGDAYTERLKGLSGQWRDTAGLSDEKLAELIQNDQIDILFDPNGHIAGNRLLMFARKPAPIQTTHFGYPNTTGLKTMDYRFSDVASEPIGTAESLNTEVLVRLRDCWYCYLPDDPVPPPNPPPSERNGHITFGCLNRLIKASKPCLEVWSRILLTVPRSRLMLLAEGKRQDHLGLLQFFGERGVSPDRIDLLAIRPHAEYLALYNDIDIVLDPFPFNGDNTTCDGMWCGVPTVTLAGMSFVSRRGVSHLRVLHLGDLIAESHENYVAKAASLAESPARLKELRNSLRDRMIASPLCDGPTFARKMEVAFREMWTRWLEGKSREPWVGEVGP